jgi:putative transposase
VKFAFIAAEKAMFPVRVLCRTLEVSRAGIYAWHTRPPAPRTVADQRLGVESRRFTPRAGQRYGSPRVHAELRHRGQRLGRKRVARLMRQHELCTRRPRRFRVTTDSKHDLPVASNVLARQFAVAAPDTAGVTDITYLWTQEGIYGPRRAGCIWRSSSISSPAPWWAGP